MRLSIFTDETGLDITKAIPHLQQWGLEWIDLRGRILGREFCMLEDAEMDDVSRLVRSFFYWQPQKDQQGALAMRPDQLQKVLDRFGPLAWDCANEWLDDDPPNDEGIALRVNRSRNFHIKAEGADEL